MSSSTAISPPDFDQLVAQAEADAAAGRYLEALRSLEQALARCLPQHRGMRAKLLASQARLHARLGQLQDSVRRASEAVALAEEQGDDSVLAEALTALTFVYAQLLMGREAMACGLRALAAARRCRNPLREAWALARIANAYASLENPRQACETTQQALEIAAALHDEELDLACLNNLAYFQLQLLDDATRNGDLPTAVQARSAALQLAERATAIARRQQNPFRTAIALSNLCEAILADGDSDTTLALIGEYQAIAVEHGYVALELQALCQRAQLQRQHGELHAALNDLQALMQARADQLAPQQRRRVTRALYETHKACGHYREALEALEALVALERQINLDTLALQTEVLLIRREVESAHRRAEHAIADAQRERERASELEREQQRLREEAAAWGRAAHEDVLTGLHNRRHAESALMLLVDGARQNGRSLIVALLDVDHFKAVNDELGHALGDEVLQELARILRESLRGADLLARVGGEEFQIAMLGLNAEQALAVCERLRRQVQAHRWADIAPGLQVSVSIGIATAAPDGVQQYDARQLQERADRALYRAKRAGRNRVELG